MERKLIKHTPAEVASMIAAIRARPQDEQDDAADAFDTKIADLDTASADVVQMMYGFLHPSEHTKMIDRAFLPHCRG